MIDNTLATISLPAEPLLGVTASGEALRLDQQSLDWLALHNQLHIPCHTWTAQFAGQSIQIRWGAAPSLDEPTDTLMLWLGDECLRLRLTSSTLAQWAAQPNSPLPRNSFDPALGALLMESALLELIEPLEKLLGVPLQVRDAAAQAFELSLGLIVALADTPEQHLRLDMTPGAAALIADLLRAYARPLSEGVIEMRFALGIEAGHSWFSLGELRSLLPGDVVMLDVSGVRMLLSDVLQAQGEHHGDRSVRLLEALNPVTTNLENTMNRSDELSTVSETLSELQLKLACQIGTVELSLAQVQQLGPGSVLQLTTHMQETVDLLINGRCVGRGLLVQLGDGLGVRLLSFAKP
jgi:type III secretion protein Q